MLSTFHDSPPPKAQRRDITAIVCCLLLHKVARTVLPFVGGISALGFGLGNSVEQRILGPGLGSLLDTRPARELPRKGSFSKRGNSLVASGVCTS